MEHVDQDLENRFNYHPADELKGKAHELIRGECKKLAYLLSELPDSREKSLALTNLEETMMWANAALARNELPDHLRELIESL